MPRILIVNDSPLHQKILSALLELSPHYLIVGIAANGAEAVRMNQSSQPDLILMDIHMPHTDGVTATDQIMKSRPTRILIVTSTVTTNMPWVFEAQAKGAMDVLKTPTVQLNGQGKLTRGTLENAGKSLFMKINILANAPIPHVSDLPFPVCQTATQAVPLEPAEKLIVIGASTGGPNAILKILSQIPKFPKTAVVVIQHIDESFSGSLVQWLVQHTGLPVQLAQTGEPLGGNRIYLAPGGRQSLLIAANKTVQLVPTPLDLFYSPNINLCMASASKSFGAKALGIILTGMADDGAQGLLQMKQAQALTLIQDSASCVVDSMPVAAFRVGAAQRMDTLDAITSTITRWL